MGFIGGRVWVGSLAELNSREKQTLLRRQSATTSLTAVRLRGTSKKQLLCADFRTSGATMRRAHQPNEQVSIDDLVTRTKVIALTVSDWCR